MRVLTSIEEVGTKVMIVLTTECCGCRMWALTEPTICMLCGSPITEIHTPVERNLDHLLKAPVTRYWS